MVKLRLKRCGRKQRDFRLSVYEFLNVKEQWIHTPHAPNKIKRTKRGVLSHIYRGRMGLCLLTDTWLYMLLRYLACLSLLYFTLL